MKKEAEPPLPSRNLPSFTSFRDIRQLLQEKAISCQDVVQYYLANIREKQQLGAFLEVYEAEALAQAAEIDRKLALGTAGRLAGMVIGLKDVLCHQNHSLQGGSQILDSFKSQFTATAVQRLLGEDVIIIGRQNCDEFAMGSSTENSSFFTTRNAANPEHVPGGSSGGSAVAVQAHMCTASLGSDTGGSIRQPAAFCGLVGMKPTYSRISRYGLIAYASSFDVIGTLTHTVEDAALLTEIMAGPDEYDSTASQQPVPAYSTLLSAQSEPRKIAYLQNTLDHQGIHPDIKEKTEQALEQLRQQGHAVSPIDFPLLEYVLPTYYILTMAEASSNLSRFDGVRYGHRSAEGNTMEAMYKKTRTEAFGEEVQRRIMLGTFVLSASYYDAYYTKAQKVRRLLQNATCNLLEEYDFIVLPTTPTPAFKLGDKATPIEMYLADLFTVQASIAGVTAISVPVGDSYEGLPIGLQIIGGAFKESDLFNFAEHFLNRQATNQPK
ncbi:Asp-tRNA(Asn)/Glu-tRNA(Gln) amidotransferase subunit GatA [Tunicatimonas pelagia]|uniref:Asp-tRNA(Asn)/Glu-tRNA(Gln) amidotransferase subunit GatA n=1 Tax=Tunicatimonas pelagia TaxID=931531 RepID=UPI002665446C|nr:Asp-tRNA(Asn)/Glu-tRNA(Gln) amidotransferase subunit GatA [Tunicatimonas pelagia]WKN41462.1 Asp-tRNA(Asn)/Glu-tRNA(Gln) amidotransferase subunit GatA [Tunicatimonas pelagia]